MTDETLCKILFELTGGTWGNTQLPSKPPLTVSVNARCTDDGCWGLNIYINLSSGRTWLKWFPVSYTQPCFVLLPGWAQQQCGGTTEGLLKQRGHCHGGQLVAKNSSCRCELETKVRKERMMRRKMVGREAGGGGILDMIVNMSLRQIKRCRRICFPHTMRLWCSVVYHSQVSEFSFTLVGRLIFIYFVLFLSNLFRLKQTNKQKKTSKPFCFVFHI